MPESRATAGAAFDLLAAEYDASFESSPSVQAMRRTIHATVARLVPQGAPLLDINCGTGTDCLALSDRGYTMTGTDASPAMIAVARAKDTSGRCRFVVCPFNQLSVFFGGNFALVLSNFGGLNCAEELITVFRQVHQVLGEEGIFVAVIMPPFSIWEFIAGILHRKLSHALRRQRDFARVAEREIPVRYYGEREVRAAASGWYSVEAVRGFNIFSPPPNAQSFQSRWPRWTTFLLAFDERIARLPPLRRWGDHQLYVMKKIPRSSRPNAT